MTREVRIVIRDDFDGTEGADTYRFGWLGTEYEIDLGPENFKTFEKVMAPYLAVAHKPDPNEAPPSTAQSNYQRKRDLDRVRTWAREKGYEVGDLGMVPRHIHLEFNENHPDNPVPLRKP